MEKPMNIKNEYPHYAAIEQHIRAARIERVAVIAETIAQFVVDCWNAVKQPPAPAAVIIERRTQPRGESPRMLRKLAHR
jgi:hypothetical protein